MKTYKVLPTNKVVDEIYNKHVRYSNLSGKEEKEKWSDKRFKGSLTPEDIDLIRFLCYKKLKQKDIAKYFNVSASTIANTKQGNMFYHHISPFQNKSRSGWVEIDKYKIEKWYLDNKAYLDSIMKSINGY